MRRLSFLCAGAAMLSLPGCGNGGDASSLNAATSVAQKASETPPPAAVTWQRPCALLQDKDFAAVFPGVEFLSSEDISDTLDADGTASGRCTYDARAFRAEDAYMVVLTVDAWALDEHAYEAFAVLSTPEGDEAAGAADEVRGEMPVTIAASDALIDGEGIVLEAENHVEIEVLDGFREGGIYLQQSERARTVFMHQGTVLELEVKHEARSSFDGHDPSIALARRLAARL